MTSIDPNDLELSFSTCRLLSGVDVEDTPGLVFWSILIDHAPLDDDQEQRQRIGSAQAVVVVSAECPNPWDACDAESGDLEAIAAAVWDPRGGLSEAAQEIVDYVGGDVLLLDRIELAPDVRGHDLGLLAAAEIIRVLGRGCDVVATQAMPPENDDMTEFVCRRGRAALVRHWCRLGLQLIPGHEADGILIGDLSRRGIGEACHLLRADHELH